MGRRNKWHNHNSFRAVSSGPTPRSHQLHRESFTINEHIGAENRSTEFKKGPGFILHNFRQNVAKYVCGFLNSKENGRLLLGVDDSGMVIGYECNHHQEDYLRLIIDEAVKDLEPAVFPNDYTIRFVPIHNEFGNELGNYKVIEILVNGANMQMKDRLYSTKQGVFIRRDGSIQELNGGAVQEWARRHFETELNKLRKIEGSLQNEIAVTQNKVQILEDQLRTKERELEQKRQDSENQVLFVKQLAEKTTQLQEENNVLKQQADDSSTKSSKQAVEELQQAVEELQEIKEMLLERKRSQICIIS